MRLLTDKPQRHRSPRIEKGKPFNPEPKTQEILSQAANEAHAWLDARYDAVFSPAYFNGTRWAVPASSEVIEGLSTTFANPDSYPTDARGVTFSFAFFSAKHLLDWRDFKDLLDASDPTARDFMQIVEQRRATLPP